MKKLLNTLYISNFNRYLSLEGENVVVLEEDEVIGRVPLHNLQSIVTFGYTGASPALMRKCVENNISLIFMSKNGKSLARVTGELNGNVTLRREQYRIADDQVHSLEIAKKLMIGKIYNSRRVLERAMRDYPLRLDIAKLKECSQFFSQSIEDVKKCESSESLLGIEGKAASAYFSIFDDLILQQKDSFTFEIRTRRPPLDKVNALLSFSYSLLANMCTGALEAVGLDAYVGFYHKDLPGRTSLALDLMEELRSNFADRFVLSLINKKIIKESDFITKESGAVLLTNDGRKTFLNHWQKKQQEVIHHPFIKEKIEWGMVPYVQALLLARYIRGDLDGYPPFLWK